MPLKTVETAMLIS